MTVKILVDDCGEPIQEMEKLGIPVDVHVRRVFLRTGLADRNRNGIKDIIATARELHPDRPVDLDSAWDVGRNWCDKGNPNCGECVLRDVCPKDLKASRGV